VREEPGLAVPETERIMLILAVLDRVGLLEGEFDGVPLVVGDAEGVRVRAEEINGVCVSDEPRLAVPDTENFMLVPEADPDREGLVDGEFDGVVVAEIDGVLEERLRNPASAFKKKGAVKSGVLVSY